MGNGSFYSGNDTVYTTTSDAGTTEPDPNPPVEAPASFYKNEGGVYAAINLADNSVAEVQTDATNAASSATAAAASASAAAASAATVASEAVRYDIAQSLTSGQKTQAQSNMGLAAVASSGAYSDLSGKPTLGTAAALNVGTAPNDVVQLDGSGKLPAVDGSQLTGIITGGVRTILSAATTFHVATTGSDTSGTGSSGSPWATLQHAMNVLALSYDFGGQNVTVSVAAGTYTLGVAITPWVGGGMLAFLGDNTTPTNVAIAVSSAGSSSGDCFNVTSGALPGGLTISGFALSSTVSAGCAIRATQACSISNGNLSFGSLNSGDHILMQGGATFNLVASYAISGGAGRHLHVNSGGVIFCSTPSLTVTLTGTPAFSLFFLQANTGGLAQIPSGDLTWSGSATGTRYLSQLNGVVNTGGGGASYFPGSAAGSVATQGQYV